MTLPAGWEYIYVVGDSQAEWTTAVPAGPHYATIDEGLEPPTGPNDADFVLAGGDGKIDGYFLSAGNVAGIERITEFWWQFRYAGQAIPDNPGVTFELWVKSILRFSVDINVNTNGLLTEGQIEQVVDISGDDWYSGPRIMLHKTVVPATGAGWGDPKYKQQPTD